MQRNLGLRKTPIQIKLAPKKPECDAKEDLDLKVDLNKEPINRLSSLLPSAIPTAKEEEEEIDFEASEQQTKRKKSRAVEAKKLFSLFIGNLGNEVTDQVLREALEPLVEHGSLEQVRVVRDAKSGKTRGFGFASFRSVQDFLGVLKGGAGMYIGTRPCTMKRSEGDHGSNKRSRRS